MPSNGRIELPGGAHHIPSQLEIERAQRATINQFVVETARQLFVRYGGLYAGTEDAAAAMTASRRFAEVAFGIKFEDQ